MNGVCFFGGYEEGYPRSDVLRRGLDKHGVAVHECRTSPRRRGALRAAILAWRYIRMRKPFPVIYVPEFRHKDVPLAWALARLTGKRLVFDPLVSRYDTKILDRGDAGEGSVQAWHNRNLDRISLGLPDMVLADTAAHAEYYAREFGVAPPRIRILPVGFDEDLFDPAKASGDPCSKEEGLRVLFFGNYLPLHGVDVIVKAARLLSGNPSVRFDLIGRGQTYPDVEEFVSANRLSNVRLLDRVPMDRLPAVISRSDVCIGVVGRTAKAGRVVANKVYQAMAMGKVVITADSPAVREFFADGKDLCLVPAGDPTALAGKIEYLSRHKDERRSIGARAAAAVRPDFTSYVLADRFISYCKELLDMQEVRRLTAGSERGAGSSGPGRPGGC
jgi:glycosyltransferase involved in cell wall biosynthesis